MTTDQKLIPGDLCVDCKHCCLLRPVGPVDAPALCVRGWPYTHRFHEFISQCPQYERVGSIYQGLT